MEAEISLINLFRQDDAKWQHITVEEYGSYQVLGWREFVMIFEEITLRGVETEY